MFSSTEKRTIRLFKRRSLADQGPELVSAIPISLDTITAVAAPVVDRNGETIIKSTSLRVAPLKMNLDGHQQQHQTNKMTAPLAFTTKSEFFFNYLCVIFSFTIIHFWDHCMNFLFDLILMLCIFFLYL